MADMIVNYDKAVADVLQAIDFGKTIPIYHNTAPEVGDAAYPFIVYRTLSVSPADHADNEMWTYQHNVRITIVSKNGSVKDIENLIIEAFKDADYGWQNTSPTVESKEFGELYTAIDFIKLYWRY